MRFFGSNSLIAVLLLSALTTGCAKGMYSFDQVAQVANKGGSVTDAGNPAIRPVSIEIAALTNASITNLRFCIAHIQVFPSDGSAAVNAVIDNADALVSPQANDSIGHAQLKAQDFNRIEVSLSSGACMAAESVRITNANGSFSTTDGLKLVFKGTFNPATAAVARLSLGSIETRLAGVAADSGIKPAIEDASGTINPVAGIKFVQSKTSGISGIGTQITTGVFAQPVTAGNRIVCSLSFDPSLVLGTTSDTFGSNYVILHIATSATIDATTIVSDPLAASGAGFSVTTGFGSNPPAGTYISCQEYSGIATSNPTAYTFPFNGTGNNAFAPTSVDLGNRLFYETAAFTGLGHDSTAGATPRDGAGNFSVVDGYLPFATVVTPIVTTGPTTDWVVIHTIFKGQ